jgi:prolyl oligopeptidase
MPFDVTSHPPVEETIHGITVRDAHRWLEDRSSPETEQWVKRQRERSESYFASCGDLEAIRARVREYLDVEIVDQPAKIRGRYFYRRRGKGQEQAAIFVRELASQMECVLVDPSMYGPDASVGIHRISRDGRLLAFEVRYGGTDKRAIHFVDVDSGLILPDRIEPGYPRGGAFLPNGDGYLYCQELALGTGEHTVRLHLFQESMSDRVVLRAAARSRESRLVLAADGAHAGAIWMERRGNDVWADFWIASLKHFESWKPVFLEKKLPFSPILAHGRILAISYEDTVNGKLVELSECGEMVHTIIPEQSSPIRQLVIAGNEVFASYLENSIPSIRCWNLSAEQQNDVNIPAAGTIHLLPNHNEEDTFFYTHESFVQPAVIFEHSCSAARSDVWYSQTSHIHQRPISVWKSEYRSTDGTPIPITLVSNSLPETSRPGTAIMTSYGGFGISSTPQFSVLVAILLGCGAIFALPHIRGGGEFGPAWHEAARRENRQVSFDDFIAAAEWLCAEDLTTPEKLGIFGGSNSGLLVGAAMTQRPGLFHAVLCIAPLLDMLRYETFDQAAKWRNEYGSVKDAECFKALYAYSPYHHVADEVNYPAILFVSGDRDERCNPAHVRKMAARLQERTVQKNPILVDYSEQRGHSPALPLSVRVEALARRVAFLCRELGLFVEETTHEPSCV